MGGKSGDRKLCVSEVEAPAAEKNCNFVVKNSRFYKFLDYFLAILISLLNNILFCATHRKL